MKSKIRIDGDFSKNGRKCRASFLLEETRPSPLVISGYNLFFLFGIISVVIIIVKRFQFKVRKRW